MRINKYTTLIIRKVTDFYYEIIKSCNRKASLQDLQLIIYN